MNRPEHLEREIKIAALDAIKAGNGRTQEQIADDVTQAIMGAISPPGDYVTSLDLLLHMRQEKIPDLQRRLSAAESDRDAYQRQLSDATRQYDDATRSHAVQRALSLSNLSALMRNVAHANVRLGEAIEALRKDLAS